MEENKNGFVESTQPGIPTVDIRMLLETDKQSMKETRCSSILSPAFDAAATITTTSNHDIFYI